MYWTSCWSNMSPELRNDANLDLAGLATDFYLPLFINYADYDFRNEQSILLLEDLLWEAPYSTYSFYDYLALAESSNAATHGVPVVSEASTWSLDPTASQGSTKSINASNLVNLQSDSPLSDYRRSAPNTSTPIATLVELGEQDEQYLKTKAHAARTVAWETNLSLLSDAYSTTSSYLQVFNSFPSTFEDYGWSSESLQGSSDLETHTSEGLPTGELLNIRPSVKDSITTSNAFQKVCRSRLDEGRAHVNVSHISNMAQGQPFINNYGVGYTDMLGKNRTSYYTTPYHNASLVRSFNTLNSLYTLANTQMFEFPFLDALKSDLIRYTWLDGYSKWNSIDVQPASVSKYSTIGVPYLRKAYDFNSNAGDSFSDVQTYFSRISRNRKNYLPNWVYSPLMLNRQTVLNNLEGFVPMLLPSSRGVPTLFTALSAISGSRDAKLYYLNHLDRRSASNSGVSIYGKSTWRPEAGISSYYHNVSTFVDLLSRRELLLRDYWFTQKGTVYLPKRLTSSPQNPLLKEVIASFSLHDPLTFSSEASRDYTYSSVNYFRFLFLKAAATSTSDFLQQLPVNSKLLNDYLFFFFMNSGSTTTSHPLTNSGELSRNQFRPLRKGISSMLRLHSTGAIAMPVELRLQILASSKDVIHSWSVPSAGVKIDCVPGYTSHRIMKFMLTGIYWGQCQEICGRYHHWMPIVVYFINRDLFFLWCTHFIYKPQTQQSWEISDRKFANFVRFVSYDKSSWLSEVSTI
jgi:hypothetical protein